MPEDKIGTIYYPHENGERNMRGIMILCNNGKEKKT